jgi:hypothetical protein
MKYLSEAEAEKFLEAEGFPVVKRMFVKKEKDIPKALSTVGLPCVMKVSGKKIVHKAQLGGVNLKVDTYSTALIVFREFKKIKGFEGVMVQKKLSFNKEFLLGIKKTDEFDHVLVFGHGGSQVEEAKDIGFRVCPLEDDDIEDLFDEVFITKEMGAREREKIAVLIRKLCILVKKYPTIQEMDVNPFVLAGDGPEILDSRILFE